MLTKWVIVYILVNGASASHQMQDVSDEATCKINGEAWVEQMDSKGYDTTEDNPTPDYNKWADYECIQMPLAD